MSEKTNTTRRDFLRSTAAVSAAALLAGCAATEAQEKTAVASSPATAPAVHVAGKERIRVGMVGCGGRGTGAARDAIQASKQVEIVALGDLVPDRLASSREQLQKSGEQCKVTDEKCFTGFDCYKKVIDCDIDYVILTAPPGFRPMHFDYAIEKGRHVFAEKPVAVDPAGVRRFLETTKKADAKKLSVVGGFVFRREPTHIEIIKRIHDGEIGEITGGSSYYNVGYLWNHPRQPEWSELEYQCRNWLYFTWLSGDLIVEQNIHRLDIQNWIMKCPPVAAYGMGGRQVRVDPAFGNIYDHFAVEYEYPNGVKITNMCRQIDGCDNRVSEEYHGTKGVANPGGSAFIQVNGGKKIRIKEQSLADAYCKEHKDLIEAITTGTHVNEGQRLADSSLTAIMGRMSAYTGKTVTWEAAQESKLDLWPKEPLVMGPFPVAPVAVPGKDPLV